MKRPSRVIGRVPALTVRLRMTLVVGSAAVLVLIPAALFGPNWVEQELIDDVLDDEAALQAELIEPLLGLIGRSPAAAVPLTQSAQSEGSASQSRPEDVELSGTVAGDAVFLVEQAGRIHEDLTSLDRIGHLDGLLQITESDRQSGVPVVMSNGVAAAFTSGDQAEARLLEADDLDSPVITVFSLSDLVYRVGGAGLPRAEPVAAGGSADAANPKQVFGTSQKIAFASRSFGGIEFVVSADVGNVSRSINRIESILWLVVPMAVAAQVLVAWKLIGRALRPVEQLTDQVRGINSGTLGERVPEPGTGDEIDRLATTMNTMLNRLEHSDTKLRQFVSDASHELRTPVAVLQSEAEVALREPSTTPVDALASGVLIEAGRLQRIVDDLLVLARHDENRAMLSAVPVDLDDVVWEEAARSRRVPVDVGAVSGGRVSATPGSARRIVAHLLDNAAHYADERVTVSLAARPDSGPASSSGPETVLTVDDDGPGIDSADRERIFERFTRLSEARSRDGGGAGLGLAVVKALVNDLGGRITVEDSPLGGARFIVSFPYSP